VATWAEVAQLPLCLLTPDMQNRRIVDAHFAAAGVQIHSPVETNSVLTLWSHLQGGVWSSVLPQTFLYLFGAPQRLKVIAMEGADADAQSVGIAVPDREPLTPSARELLKIAARVDVPAQLDRPVRERGAG
jgi:DNA-binding transcriptional LysR family regulator